jgi:hypothetical protein
MRWFAHDADLRYEPEFQLLLEKSGLAYFGAAMIVLEVLAKHAKKDEVDFALPIEGKFSTDFWRREFHAPSRGAATQALLSLAACGIIDEEALIQNKTVYAPMLRTRLDEWTKRFLQAKKKEKKVGSEANPNPE